MTKGAAPPYLQILLDTPLDDRFADVWLHDVRLALWLRLSVAAEEAWPGAATLPRGADDDAVAHLAAVGLLTLLPNDHYRMPDVDSGRAARSATGRTAANWRWHPPASDAPAVRPHTEPDAPALQPHPDEDAGAPPRDASSTSTSTSTSVDNEEEKSAREAVARLAAGLTRLTDEPWSTAPRSPATRLITRLATDYPEAAVATALEAAVQSDDVHTNYDAVKEAAWRLDQRMDPPPDVPTIDTGPGDGAEAWLAAHRVHVPYGSVKRDLLALAEFAGDAAIVQVWEGVWQEGAGAYDLVRVAERELRPRLTSNGHHKKPAIGGIDQDQLRDIIRRAKGDDTDAPV